MCIEILYEDDFSVPDFIDRGNIQCRSVYRYEGSYKDEGIKREREREREVPGTSCAQLSTAQVTRRMNIQIYLDTLALTMTMDNEM